MNAVIGETLASWREFSPRQKFIATGMYALTLSRPLINGYVAYRGRDPERDWTHADAALTATAAATDFIDGTVTRATETTTKLGAVTDPTTDHIATAIQEVSLTLRGEESVNRMSAKIARDVGMSTLRAFVVKKTNGERSVGASWAGKGNTILRMSTNTFAISPLGNRYPQVREGLQRISTATTAASGLYNAINLLKR